MTQASAAFKIGRYHIHLIVTVIGGFFVVFMVKKLQDNIKHLSSFSA
jgi:hypothetical protein